MVWPGEWAVVTRTHQAASMIINSKDEIVWALLLCHHDCHYGCKICFTMLFFVYFSGNCNSSLTSLSSSRWWFMQCTNITKYTVWLWSSSWCMYMFVRYIYIVFHRKRRERNDAVDERVLVYVPSTYIFSHL